jgi:hypothetical protein
MWVANLYKDRGATLASYIISTGYREIPKFICVKTKRNLFDFGVVCPKLKTIIAHFRIPVIENLNLRDVLRLNNL